MSGPTAHAPGEIRVLTAQDVEELLPMAECIELMRETFAGLARGEFFQPLRKIAAPPGAAGVLGSMPAYRAKPTPIFSLKALCVFPNNPSRGLDSHLGPVLVYDGSTGHLRGLMNGAAITAIRTPAASAVATDLLARTDADDLAVIGAGVQARGHIDAMRHVRTIRRLRVAGRSPERLQAMAEWARELLGCPVEVSPTIEAALRDASIICTTTNSKEPILRRDWIADGAHLNVVGSSIATAREVDGATMAAATLFVDRAESTMNEGGDFLLAVAEGAIGRDHIHAELGEVMLGTKVGRTRDGEITLFKSLGLGSEDLAAADRVLAKAEAAGRGTVVPF